MIGDKNQTFNIHRLEDEDDILRYKLKNQKRKYTNMIKLQGKKY